MNPGRLTRTNSRLVGGVCGGLAAKLGVDVGMLRVLWAAGSVLTLGLGVLAYAGLWAVLPREAPGAFVPVDVAPHVESSSTGGAARPEQPGARPAEWGVRVLLVGLLALAVLGFTALLAQIGERFVLPMFWPLFSMALGTVMLAVPGPHGRSAVSVAVGIVLYFAGVVIFLGLLGVISVRIEEWLLFNWPLLTIMAGLLLQGHALESPALVVVAMAVFVLFLVTGVAGYVDVAPAGALGGGALDPSMPVPVTGGVPATGVPGAGVVPSAGGAHV